MHIEHARLESLTQLRILLSENAESLRISDIIIAPSVVIRALKAEETQVILEVDEVDLARSYSVMLRGAGIVQLDLDPCVRTFRSDLPLGCTMEDGVYVFRLFAPRARTVQLHLFDAVDDDLGSIHYLEPAGDGIWQIVL